MVFPVVMYGCESWTTKKAECPRIDAFELWRWRRFLRIPWTARRSNQSILKEISPGCSLVGLILKLILWSPDVKSWLIWKDPDAGKDWGQEEKGAAENEVIVGHHRLNGHGFGWTPGVGDGQGGLACCGSWGCKESDTAERLNWTEWSSVLHFSKWSQLMVKLNYQSPLWLIFLLTNPGIPTRLPTHLPIILYSEYVTNPTISHQFTTTHAQATSYLWPNLLPYQVLIDIKL